MSARARRVQAANNQRRMSLVEAIANVVVGFAVAVLTQILCSRCSGCRCRCPRTWRSAWLFTAISMARSYALRRLFEAIRARDAGDDYRRARRPAASTVLNVYRSVSSSSRRLKSSGAAMLSVTVLPKRSAPALPT